MSLAQVRADLGAALDQVAETATVYTYPPSVVTPPAVVIVYDEPALELAAIGSKTRIQARYRLTVAVAGLDNEAALIQLEDLCVDVLAALPAGTTVGAFSKPYFTTIGPSDLLVTELPITLITQE